MEEAEKRRVLSPGMTSAGSVLSQSKLNAHRLEPLGQWESAQRQSSGLPLQACPRVCWEDR